MDSNKRVLIVEDDLHIAELLRMHLRDEGYVVEHAADGHAGLRELERSHWDALVLDLMLPGIDGLEICRRARAMARYTPIIIISARSSEVHRILGLELGADDYLAKPFDPRELLARVRALLRRQDKLRTQVASELRFAGWRLLPGARRLLAPDGTDLMLSRGEFSLLLALAERPGRVLGREQLLQLSRGEASDSVDRAVDLAISRLRRKLGQALPGAEALVQTLRGEGYRFDVEVEVL